MPHRRQMRRGSFGAHFDELIRHFPGHQPHRPAPPGHKRSERLQEKIDIHARLFEQAWELEPDDVGP